MAEKYEYIIDGVCYTQTPVVLGQAIQLSKNINTIVDDIDGESLGAFIESLGESLPMLMAIVLNVKGVNPKDKKLDEMASTLASTATLEQTEQVVSDFFICNPITSLLEKIEKLTGVVGAISAKLILKYFSTIYASGLPEGILPNGMQSSGDTPPQK